MRLLRLHLHAFGPFTDRLLEFGPPEQGLVLVHGANEAGKSSTLRAISDLRFGIPHNSRDNFIHAHPEMRISGVFLERSGREYALTRRKGRGVTLHFSEPASGGTAGGERPVPHEVERLLTGGLAREEYDGGFGIDHDRLRRGGDALLKGQGEIGAALFEASAGVRNVAQILDRLDQTARRFFMPGARGKNASINEALRAFEHHHGEYRRALVRPAHWTELSRKHETAARALAELESRRAALNGRQLSIRELRAVAPLLASLDHAGQRLRELEHAPLLPPSASAERAAAVSGLASARAGAEAAQAEAERQGQRLAALAPDDAILGLAQAVGRLAASVESIDRYRGEIAEATAEQTICTARVAELAALIDPAAPTTEVLHRIPSPAAKAGIEQSLRELEHTQQALEQHRDALARQAPDDEESSSLALPSQEARTALRIAQADVGRRDGLLKRLAELPAEVETGHRALARALDAVGLPDAASLPRVRLLLDSQIDEAMNRQRRAATQREELNKRIEAIRKALREDTAQRDRLLEQGAVPTPDEVRGARQHRDEGWALVRAIYVEQADPPTGDFTGGRPLLAVYEEAIEAADRLVDELARDTERAAQLQACRQAIATLERDLDERRRELERLGLEIAEQEGEWARLLGAAQLPALTPPGLREWQALLREARSAWENLQKRLDELEHARNAAQALALTLREAIGATGIVSVAPEASLETLCATASEVESEIRQREKRLDTAAGKRLQNAHHRLVLAEAESRLLAAAERARQALAPVLGELLLPAQAAVAVVRARLGEFEDSMRARDSLRAAQAKLQRASSALAALESGALTIANALGQPEPRDARIYIEELAVRLRSAEQVRAASALTQQALESALDNLRKHEEAAAANEGILTALCRAAGVASADQLPEAEERARRKREAQAEADRSSAQLAEASRRPLEELRELLRDRDASRIDAEEAELVRAQTILDESLQDARQQEESARRALQEIDGSDAAASAREAMEAAAARAASNMAPWIRSRLAHALLGEALERFRERAQGPMLESASKYFERMTAGEFEHLGSDETDDRPVLVARRKDGSRLHVDALSEGTRDQLYLALRLAALELRRSAGVDLPVILDDILMTSDDRRTCLVLQALADFARGGQVIVFTHHRHVADLAAESLPPGSLHLVTL